MCIPKPVRPAAKGVYKQVQALGRKIDRRTLNESQFKKLLVNIGFKPGVVIMLHSSMDEIVRRVPSMTPLKLIRLLIQLIGEEGTLLMPTIPFEGSQFAYVQTHRTFDVKRAPSRVGLVTEIFRRMPGVIRSLHPTHPIAGLGRRAEELLSTHHLGTAFGENSPFCKMRAFGGIVVILGAIPEALTLLHVAEELHPKTFDYAYMKTLYPITIINGDETIDYELYPLRVDRPRNKQLGLRILAKEGILQCKKCHGLKVATCVADSVIKRSLSLIDEDRYYILSIDR